MNDLREHFTSLMNEENDWYKPSKKYPTKLISEVSRKELAIFFLFTDITKKKGFSSITESY